MRDSIRHALPPALIGGAIGIVLAVLFMQQLSRQEDAGRPGYAAAVKRAGPAVVNIYSSRVLQPAICQQPRFRAWCERFGAGSSRMQSALGSGVVVHPDGYILTNNHVIEGADEILVAFADGRTTSARSIGSDPETDLAVIRVPLNGLTPISLGNSDRIEVGDVVLAIGNPFGVGQTVSAGIISAKGRASISRNPYDDFIQTDAAINPGNSGGALIDADGNLIGINTLIFTRSGDFSGIGFAIPAQLAYRVLEEIIQTGRVTRGWLGIVLTNTPAPGLGAGLAITRVDPDGPGARAGLRPGDVLLSAEGQPAASSEVVTRIIASLAPGTPLQLEVLRGDRQLVVEAIAGERPRRATP